MCGTKIESKRVRARSLSPFTRLRDADDGFSTIDFAIVLVIFALITVFAIPQMTATMRSYRALSDARSLASQLALAKMRAADGFTQSRLNCDLTGRSCQPEVCTNKGISTCNAFTSDGGSFRLSPDINFGFANITDPAGSQTSIQNTPQIQFNSRGIPVDSTAAPTANYALYLTNGAGDVYAVTLYASGRIAVWRYGGDGAWKIQ